MFRLQVLNDFIRNKLGLGQKVKHSEEFIYNHTHVISLSPTVKHYLNGEIKLKQIKEETPRNFFKKQQAPHALGESGEQRNLVTPNP